MKCAALLISLLTSITVSAQIKPELANKSPWYLDPVLWIVTSILVIIVAARIMYLAMKKKKPTPAKKNSFNNANRAVTPDNE